MLISEFIKELETIKAEHGEIEVAAFDTDDDEYLTAEPCFCLFKDEETDKVCTVVIGDSSWTDDMGDDDE